MLRARGRIAAFHVSDWLVPTTDPAFDRGMPGDGVIDIPRIRAMAEAAGYGGFVECEILSRRWWQEDPETVLRLIKLRHATAC
jgi:sugar phosphate isomerase/epimerase